VSAHDDQPLDRPDPNAVPPVSRRTELVVATAATLGAAAWLVVSPLVLPYGPGDPAVHDALAGAALLTLTLSTLAGRGRTAVLVWTSAGIGLWLAAAAIWLADTPTAAANEAACGALVTLAACLRAAALEAVSGGSRARRRGSGPGRGAGRRGSGRRARGSRAGGATR